MTDDRTAAVEPDGLPSGAGPRFCHVCGGEWDTLAGHCATCVSRAAAPPRPVSVTSPIRRALTLYFLLLASLALLLFGDGAIESLLVVGVVDSVIVLGFCLLLWRPIARALGPPVPWGWCALAVVMGLTTFGLTALFLDGIGGLFGLEPESYSADYLTAGYGWTIVVLSVCVQPALIEELAFRGVMFSSFREVLGPAETIVVTAMMFMIIHLAVPTFPVLFAMGLLLGYLRYRTGSLLPAMIMHFTHNLMVIVMEGVAG